jgi:AcrR family transcriptional regulator
MSRNVKIFQPHLSTASDARAVRTREALRQALLELLEAQSLEQITIRDIAAAAGIGYTTFFRHHPTKESLLDDLAAEQIRRLISLVMPLMGSKNERAASEAMFIYVNEQRELWSVLLTGGAAGALRDEFMRICLEIAALWPNPVSWPPADVATRIIVGSTIELLSWWLRQSDPVSVTEVARIFEALVVIPVSENQPPVATKTKPQSQRRSSPLVALTRVKPE